MLQRMWFPCLPARHRENRRKLDDRSATSGGLCPVPTSATARLSSPGVQPNQQIIVKKNPHYWNAAHVRHQRGAFLSDCRQANIEEKRLPHRTAAQDVRRQVAPVFKIDVHTAAHPSRACSMATRTWAVYFYMFNHDARPPLDNVRVRRALAMCVDRARASSRTSSCAAGSGPPGIASPRPDTGGYTCPRAGSLRSRRRPQAPRRSRLSGRQGIAAAGRCMFNTERATSARLAEAVQQMWQRELGVDGEPKQPGVGGVPQQSADDELHGRSRGLDRFVGPELSSWKISSRVARTIRPGFANPEYDRLVQAAQSREADPAVRDDDFQKRGSDPARCRADPRRCIFTPTIIC